MNEGEVRPPIMSHTVMAYGSYRVAVRRHAFGEQQLKVLDFVLCHSYGRRDGRAKAWVPAQWCIAECCGMDRGDCSKTLKWLVAQRVVEIQNCSTAKCPFALWLAILPPDTWRVPLNESSEAAAIEAWLMQVDDPEHPELWPAPDSLSDALREVFVEGHAAQSRVETRVEKSSANRSQSAQGDLPTEYAVGKVPSPGPIGQGGRVGEFPSQPRTVEDRGVGNFPIAVPSSTRDRELPVHREYRGQKELCSRETSTRSREGGQEFRGVRSCSAVEFRAYVETQLFSLIGDGERQGACGQMWERALRDMPEELNELIGQARMLRNEGRIRVSVGAWLNRSVYKAMDALGKSQPLARSR